MNARFLEEIGAEVRLIASQLSTLGCQRRRFTTRSGHDWDADDVRRDEAGGDGDRKGAISASELDVLVVL
jgi:hypothetical protein